MSKGLEELRQRRLKWIESSRENNFEEGIKRLLTDLYPDNAHFIYELLQNAEDPQASKVQFTLTHDAVEFRHNGARLFNLKDLESITSIGASTKRDDPTSIGKFGVGFKAVFAYTSTPEIHSGDFHFRIHDLVVPESNGVRQLDMNGQETRFIFPFDHPTKKAAQAAAEVERALRALGDNTLLFLKNIRTIEYLIPDCMPGSLERIEHADGHIEILARHPSGKETASHWLRFQKEVEVVDEDGEAKICGIAIAYELAKAPTGGKHHCDWEIVSNNNGQVSIYFPAEKESSSLRFHIHAPFASTVARDSIRNCEANNQLRDHIANLAVDSLRHIRDRGMLTLSFLSVLPNQTDNLSPFYEPIRKALVRAFTDEPLTPTKSGTHAPANALYRGPARISEVLNDEDLSLLTGLKPPLWAANPPQQNQREDRFLDSLEINDWGWSELAEALRTNDHDTRKTIEDWIAKKKDAWVRRFYALLGEASETHYESVDVEDLHIVRVEAGEGHDHVLPKDAFFPLDQEKTYAEDLKFVKPAVYGEGRSDRQKKQAVSFLKNIGVRHFDEKTIVELRLGCYKNPYAIADEHYKDLELFINYWKKNPTDSLTFFQKKIFLGVDAEGDLYWCTPNSLTMDRPYDETGFSDLVEIHHKYSISEKYKNELPKSLLNDFIDFAKALGVMHELKVEYFSTHSNPHTNELRKDYYKSGVKKTNTSIDKDHSISDIQKYIATKSILASRLIWNALTRAHRKSAMACFRPNQQYPIRESESQLVYHLKLNAWIPDTSGTFRMPEDMTKDALRQDFPFDDRNGLLTAIGFGARAKERSEEYQAKNDAAKQIGFNSVEEAEAWAKLVKENGYEYEQIRSLFIQHKHISQPEDSIPNPERRRKGILERRANAPSKQSVNRERAVQPGARLETLEAKAYLRAKYRNLEGQLVCQCCHAEMPFKVNDNHYFEAVQCIRGLGHHYFENRLALCPNCAAMYQHAKETDDQEIHRAFIESEVSETASSAEIIIILAGCQYKLRFVGTHWFDLKTILAGS